MKDAMILEYQDDEVILRQGDLDKNLYKVMSGNVVCKLRQGR